MKKHNKEVFQAKKLKEEKGITLIALVLTIIILLILAGVSIVLLVGDNGVLEQAQNAKTEHEQASALEDIKMEIGASYGTDGKIDIAKLNENLNKLGIDTNIESLPSEEIEYKGKKFIINEDESISEVVEKKDDTATDDEDNETFDAEEWDKTAADEDCFYWKSNIKGQEGYGTIIGYTEKIENYTKLRYPSRCTEIEFDDKLDYVNGTMSRLRISTSRARGLSNNILKVELPETVTKIGDSAFGDEIGSSFQSMESIVIPDSVTYIGTRAFSKCYKLTNIVIPESVTYIGQWAFAYWKSSQTINCRASEKPSDWETYWDTYLYNSPRQAQLVWGYTGE